MLGNIVAGVSVINPDDLLWTSPQQGGLTPGEWNVVIDHLLDRLAAHLNRKLARDSNAFIDVDRSFGFSVDFWSVSPVGEPLDFHVRGTIGASKYEGTVADYIAVQGWLFPYVFGQRVVTSVDAQNHIFMRYAKADASDTDWEMANCVGVSSWRLLRWSPDVYGEFGGNNTWPHHL